MPTRHCPNCTSRMVPKPGRSFECTGCGRVGRVEKTGGVMRIDPVTKERKPLRQDPREIRTR